MTRTLVFSHFAVDDLSAARDWYDSNRPGLGQDLILCVEHALARIIENPEAFPVILPGVRRILVRRFPYGVFYRVRQSRIEVEAVFPLRSDPSRLSERLNPA